MQRFDDPRSFLRNTQTAGLTGERRGACGWARQGLRQLLTLSCVLGPKSSAARRKTEPHASEKMRLVKSYTGEDPSRKRNTRLRQKNAIYFVTWRCAQSQGTNTPVSARWKTPGAPNLNSAKRREIGPLCTKMRQKMDGGDTKRISDLTFPASWLAGDGGQPRRAESGHRTKRGHQTLLPTSGHS